MSYNYDRGIVSKASKRELESPAVANALQKVGYAIMADAAGEDFDFDRDLEDHIDEQLYNFCLSLTKKVKQSLAKKRR